jgi:hypothetical protein
MTESPIAAGVDAAAPPRGVAGVPVDRSLRSALMGTCLILWVLSVFAIVSLYGIREQLGQLQREVANLAEASRQQDAQFLQALDKDGNVALTFRRSMPDPGACGGTCGPGNENCQEMQERMKAACPKPGEVSTAAGQ